MAQVNFRLEDNLKSEAEYIFANLGLTMSSALNIFIRQVVARRGIPFELHVPDKQEYYSGKILQAARDYENGKKNYHYHELPEENFSDLDETRAHPRSRRREKAMV